MKKQVLLLFLAGLMWSSPVMAETLTIVWATVKVLQQPKAGGRPIDLVYGNDKYRALDKTAHWYQIETPKERIGWVPASAVNTGLDGRAFLNPATKVLNNGTTLQRLGFREEATDKLFEVIRFYPDSLEYYEAVRHMLYYTPSGKLAPSDGVNPPSGGLEKARALVPGIVLTEGKRRMKMGRWEQAIPYFEERIKYDHQDREAMQAIHSALTKIMERELLAGDNTKLGLAVGSHRKYFPTKPLPKAVENRLLGMKAQPMVDLSKLPPPRVARD